jgi:hypothetical protein
MWLRGAPCPKARCPIAQSDAIMGVRRERPVRTGDSMRKMILFVAMLMMLGLTLRPTGSVANAAATVDLKTLLASPVVVTIYSADRKLVIGHAQYTIMETGNAVAVSGDARYLDGERDWERIGMEYQPGNPLPVVTSFQANYLGSDGAPQLTERADFKSGDASCTWSGQPQDRPYADGLEFPPDTYAGATAIVPLEYALKKGEQTVRFHVFDCTPKPTVLAIDAKLEDGVAHWSYHPGELAQMGLTPDLGWLNMVAKPFIPNISVWFDPRDDYQYVGAAKDRFYRGRSQIMVRSPAKGQPISAPQTTAPNVAVDPAP